MKITKTFIKNLANPAVETWHWDDTLPGFGLRVWPSGRAVYVLRYRTIAGTQRKLTIGDARAIDPDDARDRARKAVVDTRDGKDPQKERVTLRRSETVADLGREWELHQSGHVKPASLTSLKCCWRKHIVPAFGTVKLRELTRDDVERWHQKQPRKRAANLAVMQLSAAMNWAMETKEWIARNPLKKFRYYAERKRQFVMTPEQIRALIAALEIDNPRRWAAPFLFKLLLFTGLRLREWAMAEWSQFSDTTGTLTLHDSKTGARTVQLGEEARIVLRQIKSHPSAHKRWIFPNWKADGPMEFPHAYWVAVRDRAGMPTLRIHDLRHTFASYGLLSGANIKEVAQMLGHRTIRTTERYVGVFDDTIQAVQNRTAKAIMQVALSGKLPGAKDAPRKPQAVA